MKLKYFHIWCIHWLLVRASYGLFEGTVVTFTWRDYGQPWKSSGRL